MDKSFWTAQKKSATDALKTPSKRAIQKTTKATGDLVGKKIADKIKKAAWKSTHECPIKLTASAKINETSVQPVKIPK